MSDERWEPPVVAVRVDSSSSSPERADEVFLMNDGGSWFFVSRFAAVHSLFTIHYSLFIIHYSSFTIHHSLFKPCGLGEFEVDVFEVHDVAFGGCFWHEAQGVIAFGEFDLTQGNVLIIIPGFVS